MFADGIFRLTILLANILANILAVCYVRRGHDFKNECLLSVSLFLISSIILDLS